MVSARLALVMPSAAGAVLSPMDTYSCQPLVPDVDYDHKGFTQVIRRPTPEECCQLCRSQERFCDVFVWTPDNGGECSLNTVVFPLVQVHRPGVQSSLLSPCRCTNGTGCEVPTGGAGTFCNMHTSARQAVPSTADPTRASETTMRHRVAPTQDMRIVWEWTSTTFGKHLWQEEVLSIDILGAVADAVPSDSLTHDSISAQYVQGYQSQISTIV
ncbi:hypothetical protein H310_03689 [Aphanomyces invadans]|uniref:Apple domain-containing protein n=1 Tax=Aphanomyces invadans TaxID=157072 RepID=A0A024UIS8_9STRA|nr:hypothetical protein H310_03689 [Aphanomyces invadans]ETW06095.1 hypothetical protein H310_03689 [Aphanomyces invadans]|eukprot:XP_008865872.1 hypothetical protein H310_03689 [Aphanomyces invadans]